MCNVELYVSDHDNCRLKANFCRFRFSKHTKTLEKKQRDKSGRKTMIHRETANNLGPMQRIEFGYDSRLGLSHIGEISHSSILTWYTRVQFSPQLKLDANESTAQLLQHSADAVILFHILHPMQRTTDLCRRTSNHGEFRPGGTVQFGSALAAAAASAPCRSSAAAPTDKGTSQHRRGDRLIARYLYCEAKGAREARSIASQHASAIRSNSSVFT